MSAIYPLFMDRLGRFVIWNLIRKPFFDGIMAHSHVFWRGGGRILIDLDILYLHILYNLTCIITIMFIVSMYLQQHSAKYTFLCIMYIRMIYFTELYLIIVVNSKELTQ